MIAFESDSRVEFDPARHTYIDDRGPVPSVTEIVRWFSEARYHGAAAEYAKDRGHRAHSAISMLAQGILDPDTVSDDIKPYVAAYDRFVRESGWRTWATEVIVYNSIFRYAGTADSVGSFGASKRIALADWKTGSAAPWHYLQVGLYGAAFAERYGLPIEIIDLYDVYLTLAGTYALRQAGIVYVSEGKRAAASWWRDVGVKGE